MAPITAVISIPQKPVLLPINLEIISGDITVSTRPVRASTPAKAGRMLIKDFHAFASPFFVFSLSL